MDTFKIAEREVRAIKRADKRNLRARMSNVVVISDERFRCPEALFQPNIIPGIHTTGMCKRREDPGDISTKGT